MKRRRGPMIIGLAVVAVAGGSFAAWYSRTIPSPSFLPSIEVDLPPEYKARLRPGPDFDVCYFTRGDEHDERYACLGVYVGWFPNEFRPDVGANEQRGRLAGHRVTWFCWQGMNDDGDLFNSQEACCQIERRFCRAFVHAFFSTHDAADVAVLREAAASMRVVMPKRDEPATEHPQP